MAKLEEKFKVDFHGFKLVGKKDARFVLNNSKKIIRLQEHKTKGRIEADILENVLNFDLQNLFYITVDDIQYNKNCKNVEYNIIRNPGHIQRKDESFHDRGWRVGDIASGHAGLIPNFNE